MTTCLVFLSSNGTYAMRTNHADKAMRVEQHSFGDRDQRYVLSTGALWMGSFSHFEDVEDEGMVWTFTYPWTAQPMAEWFAFIAHSMMGRGSNVSVRGRTPTEAERRDFTERVYARMMEEDTT